MRGAELQKLEGSGLNPCWGGMKIQLKDSPSVTTRYHPLGPINL